MKKNIYTVYDSKAQAYLQPFFMGTDGEAIRAITDCANDVNHNFCKHASDFTLFKIGEYNDSNASIIQNEVNENLGNCLEFKIQVELDLSQPNLKLGGTD